MSIIKFVLDSNFHLRRHRGKPSYLGGVGIAIFMILLLALAVPVHAATQPPYAHAWYITNPDTSTNGKMYTLGQYDGRWDQANCSNNLTTLALLDFGQVSYQSGGSYGGYGALDFASGYPFISDSTILLAAERYTQGYYGVTGTCPHLILVFGLNNYNQCPFGGACSPKTAGQQWGNLVNNFHTWLVSQGYTAYVSAATGNDMEQPSGTQYWDCATKTRAFVDGFNGNDPLAAMLLDYGTAWLPNSCWAASDVYYVSYQASHDWPLPEVYSQAALDSWVKYLGYTLYYEGELTECEQGDPITGSTCTYPGGQWTPATAWTKLEAAVNQTNLYYSSNIRYQSHAPGQ